MWLVLLLACGFCVSVSAAGQKIADLSAQEALAFGQDAASRGELENALQAYLHIGEKFPRSPLTPLALVRAASMMPQLRTPQEAMEVLQRLVDEYPDSWPVTGGTVGRYMTSFMLGYSRDHESTIRFAEDYLASFSPSVKGPNWARVIVGLASAHVAKGDFEAAQEALTEWLGLCPHLLLNAEWFELLVKAQLAQRDTQGALSTAQAAYALCEFKAPAVQAAADLVRRTFTACGEAQKAAQFIKSQQASETPNPLEDIDLPSPPEDQLAQLLAQAQSDPGIGCIVHLYLGDNEQALTGAILLLAEAPPDEAAEAILALARVLKAIELRPMRANELIVYAKTGEGSNPLADPDLFEMD